MQSTMTYIKHLSSKLFCISTEFSPESKRVKFPKANAKMSKIPKSAQECPSLARVLPFIRSDLFILTSMVMPSITMEVIHMYISIAIKLSKYLTGLLCTVYQQLIKANVNSFMCDVLFTQVNKVHEKFTHQPSG